MRSQVQPYVHNPVEQLKLRVVSGGIDPSVALFGRSFSLGFDPAVELARNGIGRIYPIHNRLHTINKASQIKVAGRLVCVNAGVVSTLDQTVEVLKLAAETKVPAYVNTSHPDFEDFEPIVFDGTNIEGFQLLARHIRDPEQYPVETLTAHLQPQPHEQQGERL